MTLESNELDPTTNSIRDSKPQIIPNAQNTYFLKTKKKVKSEVTDSLIQILSELWNYFDSHSLILVFCEFSFHTNSNLRPLKEVSTQVTTHFYLSISH
jgi:hypothetical protein